MLTLRKFAHSGLRQNYTGLFPSVHRHTATGLMSPLYI